MSLACKAVSMLLALTNPNSWLGPFPVRRIGLVDAAQVERMLSEDYMELFLLLPSPFT